eukprot:2304726-Karenia_brevis.AAC.1
MALGSFSHAHLHQDRQLKCSLLPTGIKDRSERKPRVKNSSKSLEKSMGVSEKKQHMCGQKNAS